MLLRRVELSLCLRVCDLRLVDRLARKGAFREQLLPAVEQLFRRVQRLVRRVDVGLRFGDLLRNRGR